MGEVEHSEAVVWFEFRRLLAPKRMLESTTARGPLIALHPLARYRSKRPGFLTGENGREALRGGLADDRPLSLHLEDESIPRGYAQRPSDIPGNRDLTLRSETSDCNFCHEYW
jgi:hypothetical protein